MGKLKILSWIGISFTVIGTVISAVVTPSLTKAENQKYIDSLIKK